jgi:putative transposase
MRRSRLTEEQIVHPDLQVRRRRRMRVAAANRVPLTPAVRPNQRWSMDFTSDTLSNGRPFRTLNIVDDCSRACPAIEVDYSLPGLRVTRVPDQLAETRGLQDTIVVDNGPEFAGRELDRWAYRRGVQLHFIDPGKPVQNASTRGRLRTPCLLAHVTSPHNNLSC